ncbi:MAG: Type IV pilus assembly protein PilB [Candidatus Falkowbacteria bacterium GW2011_GWA2_39_24]|uniref:Type IV pilus assembly protein PilB n=1 Tax=Candidatus Falkowbacteria bacterium GW2011_GWA2_39_24 TaxID=1618634 RepID=A0A0G0NR05_9BACT|nr:MAG: Type IV pilus assembly protein PilB [Candidatus Falkowbacteria bacterium GW2011_GWA2_39_24]
MKKITTKKLRELLVEPGHVNEADFELAVQEAKRKRKDLADLLVSKGLIKDEQLGQLLAEEQGYKFVNLKQEKIYDEVLSLLPQTVAKAKGAIVFANDRNGVKVGMLDPDDLELRNFIAKLTGETVIPYYMTKHTFKEALGMYRVSMQEGFTSLLKDLKDKDKTAEERDEVTVDIVNMLLHYGYHEKASDIHIEPYDKKLQVRFRIDGVMHDVLSVPKNLADFIISRIKILSKMRIDERRAAQDGKLRYKTGLETIDVRVSIVPSTYGETVVMRLLTSKNKQYTLSDLGLEADNLRKIKKVIQDPHGMILTTGPTGSGKTTTLYAILKILNRPEVNVATIEDPVEYEVEGITQIQVNNKAELTFAKGLRSLVRQDPDIIMVGEIRDEETADIAVNSALTGHLVLSTLHTNDAATTLPRLIDMGVEPFLVASTVNVAMAQRLVRKICTKCRLSQTLSKEELQLIKNEPGLNEVFTKMGYAKLDRVRLYRGRGCKVCNNTGYRGRIGIYEVLEMYDNIKQLIMQRAPSDQLTEQARKNGMITMLEDGISKCLNGLTTFEEIIRVIGRKS